MSNLTFSKWSSVMVKLNWNSVIKRQSVIHWRAAQHQIYADGNKTHRRRIKYYFWPQNWRNRAASSSDENKRRQDCQVMADRDYSVSLLATRQVGGRRCLILASNTIKLPNVSENTRAPVRRKACNFDTRDECSSLELSRAAVLISCCRYYNN